MRVISDASTIASGAFFIVLLMQAAVWASSSAGFPMVAPFTALPDGAPSGFLLFSLMSLLTMPVRTVVDSEMDSALFAPAFGKDTNIKAVLRWAGASTALTFALCLAVLLLVANSKWC